MQPCLSLVLLVAHESVGEVMPVREPQGGEAARLHCAVVLPGYSRSVQRLTTQRNLRAAHEPGRRVPTPRFIVHPPCCVRETRLSARRGVRWSPLSGTTHRMGVR